MPIFLVIFLLPFAAGGAFSAVRAIELASRGNWREAALFGFAALVFGEWDSVGWSECESPVGS